MKIAERFIEEGDRVRALASENGKSETPVNKLFVSLVLPAYNEASIVANNLVTLHNVMNSLDEEYNWEIIIVNDGSTDRTGELAEAFARGKGNIRVLHHENNFGLGQALQFAFNHCRGDYIVTLDLDLSYSPDHIL